MFKIITINDIVRIPPQYFERDIEKIAEYLLRDEYEEKIIGDIGFIIAVVGVNEVGLGKILPGDGAAYHTVEFQLLVFNPDLYEIVEGEIVEIVQFGAFIRLGPLDGLCHVSQLTDDFISFDEKKGTLLGKETGKLIQEGDRVRARIVAKSIGSGGSRSGKIGLTMRQQFLGKIEWIKAHITHIKESETMSPEKESESKEE
ncbi:MAG: DNA-directed RNA polymerase [Candidatus Helarchaeota archaeon]